MSSNHEGELINGELLDTWKEIARFLGKDVRTCLRWEKEHQLPVYRVSAGSPRSKVYAYKTEIEEWLKNRKHIRMLPLARASLQGSRMIAIGIILGAILISATLVVLQTTRGSGSGRPDPTLVVLASEDPSNPEELSPFFSEGIVTGIRSAIRRLGGFRVLPLTSGNGGAEIGLPGSSPRADYILRLGAIPGNQEIRILAQLFRESDQEMVLDRVYTGRPDEYYTLRDSICREICRIANPGVMRENILLERSGFTLNDPAPPPPGDEPAPSPPEDFQDPWTLYDQGRYYAQRYDRKSNQTAIDLLGRAIKLDENFAQAYLGLAQCYLNMINFGWNPDQKWLNSAEDLVATAQSITPDLAESFCVRSEVEFLRHIAFGGNTQEAAVTVVKEGLRKHPQNGRLNAILGYFHYLRFAETGLEDELEAAYTYMYRAFWTDPPNPKNISLIEVLILTRRFADAFDLNRIITRNDGTGLSHFRQGEIYYYMDDPVSSRKIFEEIARSDWEVGLKIDADLYMGMIEARLGRTREALKILDAIQRGALAENVREEELKYSSICFGAGRAEEGYQALADFFSNPEYNRHTYLYLRYIELDRNFDSVRSEDRFRKIIFQEEEFDDG